METLTRKKCIQVYCTSFKQKIGKYTFSLRFMYFSEIYLKWNLGILDLYLEKV